LFFVANLVVAPVAGVYVDRLDRKRIMLVANLISGAATLLFAVTVWREAAGLFLLLVPLHRGFDRLRPSEP